MKTNKKKVALASVKAEGFIFTRKGSRIVVENDTSDEDRPLETILSLKQVRYLSEKFNNYQSRNAKIYALEDQISKLRDKLDDIYDGTEEEQNGYSVTIDDDGLNFGCTTFDESDVKKIAALAK